MKKVFIGILIGILSYLVIMVSVLAVMKVRNVGFFSESTSSTVGESYVAEIENKYEDGQTIDDGGDIVVDVKKRISLLQIDYENENLDYTPQVPAYQVASDCSNVFDIGRYVHNDDIKKLLAKNNFAVVTGSSSEFFDIYEFNRYAQKASFVTTDSMMHTYHLYFAMLQKNTEKNYLINNINKLSEAMLAESKAQYDLLKGSEWEEAAIKNVAFFAVACQLSGVNADVPSYAKDIVSNEISLINAHEGIGTSMITNDYEDYSQYLPRGYYEGDSNLEKYFRTMMWYGRMNYAQENETMNRCACLMSIAMKGDTLKQWQEVYDVTSFFAGASDDHGYDDYMPIIEAVYGKDIDVSKLIGDESSFYSYVSLIGKLDPPAINSVVFDDDGGETDKTARANGYRFMGQRFTLDSAIFTQLCYSKTKEASDGSKRLLPDALDVPAALGSDVAKEILKSNGNDKYPGYSDNLEKISSEIKNAPSDLWTSSLYGGWMNTLNPLLEQKGNGYPSFMTNKEWTKKNLESYLGSWTELKHDTILYSKQMVAEMGGDDDVVYDDRGYVEPEPEVFGRLSALTVTTANGLEAYGVISAEDKENLLKLGELAKSLQKIAVKELNNEGLSDDDYNLIREYGGNLEHFWKETIKDKADINSWVDSSEFPMALVADVATDPNGLCLEEAIGGASTIYVVFPLDGELHIAEGAIFTYYQFEQPISERLTDSAWRRMIGMELQDDMTYTYTNVPQPRWTESYRYTYVYNY